MSHRNNLLFCVTVVIVVITKWELPTQTEKGQKMEIRITNINGAYVTATKVSDKWEIRVTNKKMALNNSLIGITENGNLAAFVEFYANIWGDATTVTAPNYTHPDSNAFITWD